MWNKQRKRLHIYFTCKTTSLPLYNAQGAQFKNLHLAQSLIRFKSILVFCFSGPTLLATAGAPARMVQGHLDVGIRSTSGPVQTFKFFEKIIHEIQLDPVYLLSINAIIKKSTSFGTNKILQSVKINKFKENSYWLFCWMAAIFDGSRNINNTE